MVIGWFAPQQHSPQVAESGHSNLFTSDFRPPYPTPTELAFLALELKKKSAGSEAMEPDDPPEESTGSTRAATPGKESDSGPEASVARTANQQIVDKDTDCEERREKEVDVASHQNRRPADEDRPGGSAPEKKPLSLNCGRGVGDGPPQAESHSEKRTAGHVPLSKERLLKGKVVRSRVCSSIALAWVSPPLCLDLDSVPCTVHTVGFHNVKVTLLKGDAAEVLNKERQVHS